MRDWDFERFFPNSSRNSVAESTPASKLEKNDHLRELNNDIAKLKATGGIQKSRSSIFGFGRREETPSKNLEDRVKSEIFANKVRNEAFLKNLQNSENGSKPAHKRQESDSKISLNFVRGFRRENTDFFPLSKRHSAILGEQVSSSPAAPQVPLRSSAIFRRGNQNKGEPILTDFTSRDLETQSSLVRPQAPTSGVRQSSSVLSKNLDFLRPRREKTESVIVVNKSRQQQQHAIGGSGGTVQAAHNQQQQQQPSPPRTQVMRPEDATRKFP